jgi:hypothetical protein
MELSKIIVPIGTEEKSQKGSQAKINFDMYKTNYDNQKKPFDGNYKINYESNKHSSQLIFYTRC